MLLQYTYDENGKFKCRHESCQDLNHSYEHKPSLSRHERNSPHPFCSDQCPVCKRTKRSLYLKAYYNSVDPNQKKSGEMNIRDYGEFNNNIAQPLKNTPSDNQPKVNSNNNRKNQNNSNSNDNINLNMNNNNNNSINNNNNIVQNNNSFIYNNLKHDDNDPQGERFRISFHIGQDIDTSKLENKNGSHMYDNNKNETKTKTSDINNILNLS